MNKGQIITDYRQARNRRQMISILAQLNDCTRTKIENVLREAGLDIPAKRKTKAWRRVNYAEVELGAAGMRDLGYGGKRS